MVATDTRATAAASSAIRELEAGSASGKSVILVRSQSSS
jgi:hypothetical protein